MRKCECRTIANDSSYNIVPRVEGCQGDWEVRSLLLRVKSKMCSVINS